MSSDFTHWEDTSISGFLPNQPPSQEESTLATNDSSTTDLRDDEKSSATEKLNNILDSSPPPSPQQTPNHQALTIHRRSDDPNPNKGSAKSRRKAFEKIQRERLRREALELEAVKRDDVTRQLAVRVSDIQGARGREGLVTPLKSTSTPSRTPKRFSIQTPSTIEGRKSALLAIFESNKEEDDRRLQDLRDHSSSLCKKGMDHTSACHFKTNKLITDGHTRYEGRLLNLEHGMRTLLSRTPQSSKPEYVTCSTTAETTSIGTESDRMLALEKENRRLNGIIKKRLGYEPKRRR